MRMLVRLLLIFIFFSAGCAQQQQTPVTDITGVVCPLPIPVTYTADIPCRDCSPTSVSLTLRSDSLYFLQVATTNTETGVQDIKAEIGIWQFVSVGNTILLATYDNVARTLLILPTNNLRVIKVSGGIIPPDVNYDLTAAGETSPNSNEVVRIQGMYSYVDGKGVLTECLTEIDFPVAAEAENAALERAYMNTPHGQAEPILVNLDARLVSKPKIGGLGYQEAVVPDRFIDIRPGIACDGGKSNKLRLVDNSWRLVELNGKPIKLPEGVKNPFIHLATKNNQMRGFSGCNNFNGTYLVKGDLFLFNKMFVRRMACVGGMKIEDRFYRMLSAAEGYKIIGDILELRNRNGQVLARFQHIGGN